MQWTKPEFQEITLNMEVTAYVNTDGDVFKPAEIRKNVGQVANLPGATEAGWQPAPRLGEGQG